MLEIPPMKFTELFKSPLEKVWNLFVNKNGWDPWFTDGMKMEVRIGGKIHFRWNRITDGEEVTDTGLTIALIPYKLWEFWWYEYEDGFRSRVEIKFHENENKETWVTIVDHTLIKNIEELQIRYGCAYGWGQMLLLAKAYLEKEIILI